MSTPAWPTPDLLVLCTGNAARSVMAGSMLDWLARARGRPLRVETAGTHAVGGQPAGHRTQAGLASIPALAAVSLSSHRSAQLTDEALRRGDLVVAMEADHVRYVRAHHPGAARRTGTLRRLCRDLEPGAAPLAERIRRLGLERTDLDDDEDVADPAGGDAEVYRACAAELWVLCQELVLRL